MTTFTQLPLEIQLQILNYLVTNKRRLTHRDRENLLGPMKVNSFWFHHTTDILWHSIKKLENTFKHLSLQDDRRQLYVSKICNLELHTAGIYFDLYENLKFHGLRALVLRGDHMSILPFLQPNLDTIVLRGSFGLTRHELDQMTILCPNLRVLNITPGAASNYRARIVKPNPDPIDPNTLSSFQNHFRHLKSLTIGRKLPKPFFSAALNGLLPLIAGQLEELILINIEYGSLPLNTQNILEACTFLNRFEIRRTPTNERPTSMNMILRGLAATTRLTNLHLDHDMVEEDVRDCIAIHNGPFKDLQTLTLKGDLLPVSSLLSLSLESLTRLRVVVGDQAHHICPSISRLKSLTFLDLVIGKNRHKQWHRGMRFLPGPHDWHPTHEDLQALSALGNLRSLKIRSMNINVTASWLTDEYFNTWISQFPHLQHLELDIECPLTFAAIVNLSNSHPFLRGCALLWIQRIEDWRVLPSTRFVELQRLKLNVIMYLEKDNTLQFAFDIFNMVVGFGGMGITPLVVNPAGPDPYRRPGIPLSEPRVNTLELIALDPPEE